MSEEFISKVSGTSAKGKLGVGEGEIELFHHVVVVLYSSIRLMRHLAKVSLNLTFTVSEDFQ